MIRDADKLDILYALGDESLKEIFREDDSEISERITKEFYQNKPIRLNFKETDNENIISLFSLIFDFNFTISITILKQNKYYEKIFNRLNDKNKFKPYIENVYKYIDERTR